MKKKVDVSEEVKAEILNEKRTSTILKKQVYFNFELKQKMVAEVKSAQNKKL